MLRLRQPWSRHTLANCARRAKLSMMGVTKLRLARSFSSDKPVNGMRGLDKAEVMATIPKS